MSERVAGYYWTRVDGEWEPAFHQGDGDWRIFGGWADDDWFEEIGDRIPEPDEEGWHCVPETFSPSVVGEIVDEVFDGAIEDDAVIYDVIESFIKHSPRPR
ncbi:hypothetical protein [Modicisalibacter coralii]|uniref:hypothetical protein n=1 Tax=Modicisalibacter coralii TaxID=2304602 RepID=UPI00100B37FB|nr:hypothetical protein [Halomonas coralii]